MKSKLIISFDFELGWGVLEGPQWKERERAGVYRALRTTMVKLVNSLVAHQIPTTWAIVSGMLSETGKEVDLAHLPGRYAAAVEVFLREAEWETRCGIDLIELLCNNGPMFEIASHSSTHFYASHEDAATDACVADLIKSFKAIELFCKRAAGSVIFPRDEILWTNEMLTVIPRTVRVNPYVWRSAGKRPLLLRFSALRRLVGLPQSRILFDANGILWQSGSLFFNHQTGRMERQRFFELDMQISRMLRQLGSGNSIYHVWLHPFNLARSPKLFVLFMKFITQVAYLRDKNVLDIMNMGEVFEVARLP